MIKRICCLLCLVLMLSSFAACSSSDDIDNISSNPSSQTSTTPSEDDTPADTDETPDPSEGEDTALEDDTVDFDGTNEEDVGYIYDLNVYNSEAPLSTRYGGMSGTVYHAFGFMKDDMTGRVYTDKMMDTELSRLEQTGIHFCRTRFHSAWAWDNKEEQYDWSKARFGYFCDYAKALQERNMEIILQVGWHFGVVSQLDQVSIGEIDYLSGFGEDLFGESVGYDFSSLSAEDARMVRASRRFGHLYSEMLRELRARGINNISHLAYWVEPSNGYSGKEEGHANREYVLASKAFKEKLTEEKLVNTVQHMGPNETYRSGDNLFRYTLEHAPDLFDCFSCHTYPLFNDVTDDVLYDSYGASVSSYESVAKEFGVLGKYEFWIDEYDVSFAGNDRQVSNSWAGLQTVYGCLIAQQHKADTMVFWQLMDQLWTDQSNTGGEFGDGIHMCGSIPSLFISATPYAQYYSHALFSRYNGYQNGKSYRTSLIREANNYDGVYIGAAQLEDGNWTFTVVNLNLGETNIRITLDESINQTLYRHLCVSGDVVPDPSARLADADKCYKDVKNVICDTLPGGSVAVYTGVKG